LDRAKMQRNANGLLSELVQSVVRMNIRAGYLKLQCILSSGAGNSGRA
jgi:hypothetical protein